MRRAGLLIGIGALTGCGAPLPTVKDITIEAADFRIAPVAAQSIAGYLTIYNSSATDDTLTEVSTVDAKKAGIHSTMEHEGLSMMMADDFLVIPAGARVVMQPGGTHLMLEEFARPLTAGDSVVIVLLFARAGQVEFTKQIKLVGEE